MWQAVLLLVLVSLTPVRADCQPQCSWACDNPTCDAICHPVCADPICAVQCPEAATCRAPSCRVVCPTDQCAKDDCPMCETVCDPPSCTASNHNCNVLCEPTNCSWECRKPFCRRPQCVFQCESPACAAPTSTGNRCVAISAASLVLLSVSMGIVLWHE